MIKCFYNSHLNINDVYLTGLNTIFCLCLTHTEHRSLGVDLTKCTDKSSEAIMNLKTDLNFLLLHLINWYIW